MRNYWIQRSWELTFLLPAEGETPTHFDIRKGPYSFTVNLSHIADLRDACGVSAADSYAYMVIQDLEYETWPLTEQNRRLALTQKEREMIFNVIRSVKKLMEEKKNET